MAALVQFRPRSGRRAAPKGRAALLLLAALAAAAAALPRAARADGAADAVAPGAARLAGALAGAGADLLEAAATDPWEIPDMQASLQDAWDGGGAGALKAAGAASLDAAGGCGAPAVRAAGCPALVGRGARWWTGDASARNAFLMATLMRDNYPNVHNLGADGDDTPAKRAVWQCLLRQKWLALGADRVEFYDSPLNTVVVVQAGDDVLVNVRGTWTQAHRDNNMEWRLGARKRVWGAQVRYHTGWGKSAEDAWAAARAIVRDFGLPRDRCRMHLSGHSRGGGVALLMAAFADGRDAAGAPCRVGGVWTFGAVKPFDAAFARAYNARLGNVTWNWWNEIDVVSRQRCGL